MKLLLIGVSAVALFGLTYAFWPSSETQYRPPKEIQVQQPPTPAARTKPNPKDTMAEDAGILGIELNSSW